jgi:outer membrane protein assembly factor BamB
MCTVKEPRYTARRNSWTNNAEYNGESMTRYSGGGNRSTLDRRHLLATAAAGVGTTVVPGVSSGQESSETTQAGVTSTDGPVAYVGSHLDEEFGLHAIDTETGSRVWTFKESRRFAGGPTVVDGVVYSPDYTPAITFESDTARSPMNKQVQAVDAQPADHKQPAKLYAVDAATGEQKWATQIGESLSIGPPTVVDGTVYVGHGITDEEDGFAALDAETGEIEWRYNTEVRSSLQGVSVVDGTLYGVAGESLFALDTETGEEEWNYLLNENAAGEGSPLVYDGVVYVGHGKLSARHDNPFGTIHAIDAATGEELWSLDGFDDQVDAAPVYADGTVYFGAARKEGTLTAVDAATGDVLWQKVIDSVGEPVQSPAVVGELVFVGTGGDGSFYALNANTGDVVWRNINDAAHFRSVTVFDRTVFVGGLGEETMNLYSFDALTGEKLTETPFEHDVVGRLTSPTIVADPETGSSVDSRVQNGVLGHHGVWARRASTTATALVDAELPPQDRTIVDRPPRNYTEADFGVESIQLLSEGNPTQELTLTVDVASQADSETLELDYGETAEHGVELADVALDTDGALADSVESIDIQSGEERVVIQFSVDEALEKATQTLTLEWTGTLDGPVSARPRHTLTLNGTPMELSYRLIGRGPTVISSDDAKFNLEDSPVYADEISPNRDGTEGAFRVWNGQSISIQVEETDQVLPIWEYETITGIITDGEVQLKAVMRPGTVTTLNTSVLGSGRHTFAFDGKKAVSIVEVAELNLSAGWTASTIDQNEPATVEIQSEAPADDDMLVEILNTESGDVVAAKTVQVGEEGGATATFDPGAAFPGSGTYDVRVTHVASELTATSTEPLEVTIPPVVGEESPNDLNSDGLYRDIDGDGEFTVGDVQALFEHRDDSVVQNNAELFNFSGGDESAVTLEDVRALYSDLQSSGDDP